MQFTHYTPTSFGQAVVRNVEVPQPTPAVEMPLLADVNTPVPSLAPPSAAGVSPSVPHKSSTTLANRKNIKDTETLLQELARIHHPCLEELKKKNALKVEKGAFSSIKITYVLSVVKRPIDALYATHSRPF